MHMIAKLVVSLLVAGAAFALATTLSLTSGPLLLAAFCVATVVTTLLVSLPLKGATPAAAAPPVRRERDSGRGGPAARQPAQSATAASGPRENGQVKWFNGTKGFGFITRDDGQEIFVHFRSIRGQGRRGLRDGQRVSFVVAQTDKGPQAEDVNPEE